MTATFVPNTAWQPSAFQNNAYQIDVLVVGGGKRKRVIKAVRPVWDRPTPVSELPPAPAPIELPPLHLVEPKPLPVGIRPQDFGELPSGAAHLGLQIRDAQDIQDALAALAAIPDPALDQAKQMLRDLRDQQDAADALSALELVNG